MARPRKRFCPHGHDKDAKGGSIWKRAYTLKGTLTYQRECALCTEATNIERSKQRKQRRIDERISNVGEYIQA